MGFNEHDRKWHRVYESLQPLSRQKVDKLLAQVRGTMVEARMPVANDDRAEALVAALTRYVVESMGHKPEDYHRVERLQGIGFQSTKGAVNG